MNIHKLNRKLHYWAAIITALPLLIILGSGILLQLKKQSSWIQPKTMRTNAGTPGITFPQILEIARSTPQAKVKSWSDIDRLDVRPDKGIIKIRCKNHWEIQINQQNGKILQTAYRRSDIIESIHDGSFFHDSAKLWIFLPAAILLFILWLTGIYLFLRPFLVKRKT